MKQLYNWDTNILDYTDKNNNNYHLELRGDKNIIGGASATGKTFLCNNIQSMLDVNDNISYKNITDVVIINKYNKSEIKNLKHKLIVVDNADLVLKKEDLEFIESDTSNRYLLFARMNLGLDISPNHYAELETNENITVLRYFFDIKGWR